MSHPFVINVEPALFDHPFKAEKITLNVNFRKHRMV